MHSSAVNVSIVNHARPPMKSESPAPPPFQGPAKPARTYKSINRSKSFNVHGMNGTNDPSPIYLSKLNRSNISHHPLYRSNPHLAEDRPQLRSPSIVNLISRSQRDLSKIDEVGDVRRNSQPRQYSPMHYTKNVSPHDRRAQSLMRTTSDNYRTEFDQRTAYKYGVDRNYQRERESSLGSRSPITLNKDTAAIIRRNHSDSSGEDYTGAPKHTDSYHSSALNGKGASRYRNGDAYTRYAVDRRNSSSPVVIEVRGRK